ncbi:hypothetical protein TRFO_16963 [Tritrichomonas foetus]|uniref:Uncharacterized protein n=1 Tax=Tritrichomonas foetus TaxID=1144522 RepID=A0A1J4KNY2_9EUKA|nr:hypothetical protein TRFO_16963 [Tritrichomonas foetus]|eukprot:OHT13001.1 hypothetical protein TRFO_16963 [Tritrichomonas foetus]
MWYHEITIPADSQDSILLLVNGHEIQVNDYVFETLCPSLAQSNNLCDEGNMKKLSLEIPHLTDCNLVKDVFSNDGVAFSSKNGLNLLMVAQALKIKSLEEWTLKHLNGFINEADLKLSGQNTPSKNTKSISHDSGFGNQSSPQSSSRIINHGLWEYLDIKIELESLFPSITDENLEDTVNDIIQLSSQIDNEEICKSFIFSATSKVVKMDKYIKFYNIYKKIYSNFTPLLMKCLQSLFNQSKIYHIYHNIRNELGFLVKYIHDVDHIEFNISCDSLPEILKQKECLFKDESSSLWIIDDSSLMSFYKILLEDNIDIFIDNYGCYIKKKHQISQIRKCLNYPFHYLNDTSSMLDYAAFFGAEKCFKYILSLHFDEKIDAKYAIAGGNSEIIKLVEKHGCDFSNLWFEAIQFKHFEIFEWIISKKVNKNYFDEKSIAEAAFSFHNMNVIHYLLEENLIGDNFFLNSILYDCQKISFWFLLQGFIIEKNSINYIDENGNTPLILAVNKNRIELTKILLQHRWIIVDKVKTNSYSAFQRACLLGNIEIIKLFLEYGNVNVMEIIPKLQTTPIEYAINHRDLDIVIVLLDHLNLNDVDSNILGQCFFLFCFEGEEEYIEKLICLDKVDLTFSMNGMSPLHAAVANNHNGIVEILNSFDNIVNQKDYLGQTPLHIAALKDYENMAYILLQNKNINIDLPDSKGETPLFTAIRADSLQVAKILLKYGANLSLHNDHNLAPIHLVAEIGTVEMFQLILLTDPKQINMISPRNLMPIQYSMKFHNYKIIEYILEKYPEQWEDIHELPDKHIGFIAQYYFRDVMKLNRSVKFDLSLIGDQNGNDYMFNPPKFSGEYKLCHINSSYESQKQPFHHSLFKKPYF